MRITALILVLLAFLPAPAIAAADFAAGYDAYRQRDYRAAEVIWRPLAEAGQPAAQLSYGLLYYHGRGVVRDAATAIAWITRAAEQDFISAQVVLAVMNFEGDGTTRDYVRAARWFRRAAEHGNAYAQNALGVMYRDNLGMPNDLVQAYVWFALAAHGKNPEAADNRDGVARKLPARYRDRAERLVKERLQADASPRR